MPDVKPSIVLLHGAFQNAHSTWNRVQPILESHGYKVITVNLPGRDDDKVDPKTLTLDIYRDSVLNAISSEENPVVLVGHSFGGITISNTAESTPGKIKALVYLSAYLPQDGQSLMTLASQDKDSLLAIPGNLEFTPDYSIASIKQDQKAAIFANDANEIDREIIVSSLIPEPAAPQQVPLKLTNSNYGAVPKYYIETSQDKCVSHYLQKMMVSQIDVAKITTIDAGHASYITQPQAVADAILEVASIN